MHFALCKEQQHSQKQDFFVIVVLLKLQMTRDSGLSLEKA
jgi:hypothetical protein